MTIARKAAAPDASQTAPAIWINRGLEVLWLSCVVLVPLAFVDRDYMLSEARIAYLELPKIALLRTLVGLMAVLWLIEWAIQKRPLRVLSRPEVSPLFRPVNWLEGLHGLLPRRPTNWRTLAVGVSVGTTVPLTVLAASR